MLHSMYTICKYFTFIHLEKKNYFCVYFFTFELTLKSYIPFQTDQSTIQNPDNTYSKISVNCHSQDEMLVW